MRPDVRVGVIPPEEEDFGDSPGAIAIWIKEVYARSALDAIVAVPRGGDFLKSTVSAQGVPIYMSYMRLVRLVGDALGLLSPRLGARWIRLAKLRGRVWIGTLPASLLRCDVLHVHNRPDYARFLRARGFHGCIILHMHNDIHNYGGEARLERALQFVDSIATCSRFLAEDSIYDKCRPFVLPNGCSVELGDFLAPEARSGMTLIGRLVPDKGILEGIEVCRRLNLRGYRMELRIVGKSDDQLRWSVKDSYARSCRHAAARVNAQLGWEAVKLVGHVPHSELLTLLRATAFLLHPCNWDEPFGMAVLEAMAAGAVPVVAATGGLPELVRDGVTGLLLPAGAKPEAYVDRILGASLATRGKLASQARESALSEYQWPVIVERFEGLVYECVGQ